MDANGLSLNPRRFVFATYSLVPAQQLEGTGLAEAAHPGLHFVAHVRCVSARAVRIRGAYYLDAVDDAPDYTDTDN